ncbi:hypothetical protein EBZ80_01170 [bacterium]|nr:hypothetical protein [bacterium]
MRELRLDASDLRPYELGCRIDGIDLSCRRKGAHPFRLIFALADTGEMPQIPELLVVDDPVRGSKRLARC